MLGGSESTMDLTCGRRETVEKCGEQPQGPRRKCARREKWQGEKERNGRNGRQKEEKATRCTSCCTCNHSNNHSNTIISSNSSRSKQSSSTAMC